MASYYKGAALTAEQVTQYAYQAGFRGDALWQIVGLISQRESKIPDGQPNAGLASTGAHRTSTNRDGATSGDFGLAQINWGAWGQQLIDAGVIRSATDLYDPATNLKAAKFVHERQGMAAWGAGPGGWRSGGDAMYGVNGGAAQAAVQRAISSGLVNQDATTGTSTAASAPAVGGLPRDARLVEVPGVARYAVFQIMPGVWIRYAITANSGINTAGRTFTRMTQAEWAQATNGGKSVNGGDASELADIPTGFGTYQGYLNAILDQVFPAGDPRRNDPEIMRVLATRAGRPDMTEAEFENLLKATNYYQTRTEGQLRWNDLSEAERNLQREDVRSRMNQAWQSYVGQDMPNSPAATRFIDLIASGQMGFGQWTETALKPTALGVAESPWARQVREEKENQRQRPIDIENSMLRVRETLANWGLNWSEKTIREWATGIVTNTKSDDDLTTEIQKQAATLYSWKDPETETIVAAAPWIEAYNRTLNRQGSLRTPEIARALAAYGRDPDNNDPWAFEQRLRETDDFYQTKDGEESAYSLAEQLAALTGN